MRHWRSGFLAVTLTIIAALVFVCIFNYFISIGSETDAIRIQDESPPTQQVWCAGDAMSFRNSALVVEDGEAKYVGTITNTCKYPAIITVIVKVGREDGVKAAPDDFFIVKDGEPVMPGETVAYARIIQLSDDPSEQQLHTYNIHKYGYVSVDADPNAGKD